MTIADANHLSRADFVRIIGPVFEHSPWIAEKTIGPFTDVDNLHQKLCQTVSSAAETEKLALIRAHPDLVGRMAREGKLTRESTGEQAAAGLAQLSAKEIAQFEHYNAEYRARFGFPFVICARENRKETILASFPVRLRNEKPAEIATALEEIYKIAGLRLRDLIED